MPRPPYTIGCIKHCCNPSVCPSVRLFVRRSHARTLIGIPCWKSNPLVSGSNQNGNEAVACAASEAFVRWLHYRYARHCPRRTVIDGRGVRIVLPRDTLHRHYILVGEGGVFDERVCLSVCLFVCLFLCLSVLSSID